MPAGDVSQPADDALAGRILAERYRVVRKLGQGAIGTVYLAQHALIEKKLALKVLSPELAQQGELVARFLHEAKCASRIGHENVVDISDFGQSPEGLVYVAMEFLDGQDLARVLATEGALPWARARAVLMQLTKALRAAHEHGVVHRDLKPSNVFLLPREGRADFVKVVDFGVARAVTAGEGGARSTETGAVFGAAEYMAPEQAHGGDADHRADVYGVGCLMYHLLTGSVPLQGETFASTLARQMTDQPQPPRARRPDLPIAEDVEAVCMRALEKDRANRWQDMDAFYRALGAAGGEAFEPSGVYIPHPSLRFPVLPQPSAHSGPVRITGEAAAAPPPSGLDDEERPAARRRAGIKLGIVMAGAALVAALVMLALRPTTRGGQPPAPAAPASATGGR